MSWWRIIVAGGVAMEMIVKVLGNFGEREAERAPQKTV